MSSPPPAGCPFVAGSMIADPQCFVGRRDELEFIASRMAAAQPTSINVVGERRIGKSSLLYHFFTTWDQQIQRYGKSPAGYVVVYLSLQNAQCRQEMSFYEAVAKELLKRSAVSANATLENALRVQPLDRMAFADAMDVWKGAGVLPVLCLDKFEELLESRKEFDNGFYDNLRSLMDRSALMLVIASQRNLATYRRQYGLTSDFFNVGHVLSLQGLTEMEARDLVRLPDPNQPALSEERQQLALAWGQRHPYLLQLAAQCLWEARERGDMSSERAKAEFLKQSQVVPRPTHWRILRWILWDFPRSVGQVANQLGVSLDALGAWIAGVMVLILAILVVLGVLNWEQVRESLSKILGG